MMVMLSETNKNDTIHYPRHEEGHHDLSLMQLKRARKMEDNDEESGIIPFAKSVHVLFGLERRTQSSRRMTNSSDATTATLSPENEEAVPIRVTIPSSLSYSVPPCNGNPPLSRERQPVDVIATYMNTNAEPHSSSKFTSPRTFEFLSL